MQPVEINKRIADIKGNTYEINKLVEEYKPFIASCAQKFSGKYMEYGLDDELSIAMLAFVEAINSFNESKGSFLSFARNVIKRRLIDYYRSERKHNNVVPLNMYIEESDEELDLSNNKAMREYSDRMQADFRRMELESLKCELEKWQISFQDLAKCSPKHTRTRNDCAKAAGVILSNHEIVMLMMDKKYLPILEISKASKLPRKLLERFRKYIVALVIIATGDYEYIRDYIKL